MSLSTTTTATYELVKYSRAYNHITPTAPSEQAELQWQHFANPVIKLIMDTRKDSTGHLESYRLRIVWTFSAEPHAMDVDQREVVFEDLDLVTYSAMPSLQPSMHGIPLKAVYQDAVVGLRYQHPRVASAGANPQYRRFQIAFENAAAASTFIDSIRFVCPCKANAPPARGVARAPTVQANTGTRPRATHSAVPSTLSIPALQTTSQSMLRSSQSTVDMVVDEPTPSTTIRRMQTSLPPFSSLVGSSPAGWDTHIQSQSFSSTQAPPSTYAQDSTARHWEHSKRASTADVGSEVTLGRGEGAYNLSSRPSSAVSVSSAAAAHASSSSHRASDVYAPALSHTPASASAVPDLLHPPALASTAIASRDTASTGRPAQVKSQSGDFPSRPAGSSDMSDVPSSSFPQASSSPPRSGRPRQSSPDLMPPPPVPPSAVAAIPGGPGGSEKATASAGVTTDAIAQESDISSSITTGTQDSTVRARITTSLTMQEGLSVYGLPKEELEALVAEVIREEGFAELVRRRERRLNIKHGRRWRAYLHAHSLYRWRR
ncbi:hypothetical protein C8Q73DRAFT_486042 [Cubamyces lactineus]|nr:hypothetical protein C8Q73DRAFT_486042 [Cubamyces lactineus]